MVEDKNINDKLCIDKVVTNETTKSTSCGFVKHCDNAKSVQQLIAAESNGKEQHRPFQFGGVRDGEKKTQEVTVIGADHNSLNANSTIDSRACYKPEKKVIKLRGRRNEKKIK